MKKILHAFFLAIVYYCPVQAQELTMYPSHWFTGMQRDRIQLILKSNDSKFFLSKVKVEYPGVSLVRTHRFSNGKYLVVDLSITQDAMPGNVRVIVSSKTKSKTYNWVLKKRREGRGVKFAQGVTSKDFIYLIMPDRFSNGDPANDRVTGLQDENSNRQDRLLRHGGDLKGVQNHIGYLKDLGVTTVWMTPVIENNMPRNKEAEGMMSGYHGYWLTDHYKVDSRLGGNKSYRELSDSLHANGMKLIQDAVYNHIGSHHWMALEPPAPDWINKWETYKESNHRDETIYGKYASEKDKRTMLNGWVASYLPDINQKNSFVTTFLIQHAIWSTEEFGVDGWRVGSYKYCDEVFLNRINEALVREYPRLTIFGDTKANTVTGNAYFTRNNMIVPFKHNAGGVTDFPLNSAIIAALNQAPGWTEGINKLYMTLAQDILYQEPKNNCIFLDNHDMDRFYSVVNEDISKFKQGIGLLLTVRGIPQLYYGTEVLMKNDKKSGDAVAHQDFPGGFKEDEINKFEPGGRTAREQEAFDFVSKLAKFRKTSSALTTGKSMHYLPVDGLYVYFRYDEKQRVMCVLNTGNNSKTLSFDDYTEQTKNFTKARDVLTNEAFNKTFDIPAKRMMILELQK